MNATLPADKFVEPGDPTIESPEYKLKLLPNVWVYDGEAYDFTDFVEKHPGGDFFIGRMKNRDITTLVNIMHANPAKVKKRFKQYALNRKVTAQDIHPKYLVPNFLFKPDFDSSRDTPKFTFEKNSELLNNIRARLKEPAMKKMIARMDRLFDGVTVVLAIAYVSLQVLWLNTAISLPAYVFVSLIAVFQIENSYDLTMIGNKYVDCFLSAGLSPHRVHHVLPYQKSGFANIVSEPVVREEAEKVGVEWARPKNFFVDRLPVMIRYYLFSPSRLAKREKWGLIKEHFSIPSIKLSIHYVYTGFVGIGSI